MQFGHYPLLDQTVQVKGTVIQKTALTSGISHKLEGFQATCTSETTGYRFGGSHSAGMIHRTQKALYILTITVLLYPKGYKSELARKDA